MSGDESSKPRPPVSWKTITRVADEAARGEMEQLAAMTDEELDAELGEAGFAPDAASKLVEAALAKAEAGKGAVKAPAPVKVVDLEAERARRRPPVAWLTLVAAAGVVVVVGGGATYVALRSPEPAPTTPVPTVPTAPPGPSPELLARQAREKADGLRVAARAKCAEGEWGACTRGLEAAAKLDPAGDAARAVQRLRREAERGTMQDQLEAKGAAGPRFIDAHGIARFVAALAPSRGQAVTLACARGAEPQHLCGQLAAAMTKAGWVVTRGAAVPVDGGQERGVRVEIATDAGEAAQDAADALSAGLDAAPVSLRGPLDVAPGGDAPLRLVVGTQ